MTTKQRRTPLDEDPFADAALDDAITTFGQKVADEACKVLDMVFRKYENRETQWLDAFQAVTAAAYILEVYLDRQHEEEVKTGKVQ
jgi:hypothetical protein